MDPILPDGRAEGRIAMLPVTVDQADAAELQVCARELRVPVNVVMLAEWARALARPGGRDPVAIGVLRSLRTAEHARTSGCFINSLPVFVHGGPDTPLADCVEQLRVQLKGIRRVQQYPVGLLAQHFSGAGVAPGRPPFFDASFNYLPSDESAFSSMITGRQAGRCGATSSAT
ncbi:condensation domain-containing protein [Kribbella sp. NBC_01505]|uniref:condensation domain-containing protein n=1 Tax=Kribbella sp. NBC_01505 TaxID=2903580 RepID=UPI0038630FE1